MKLSIPETWQITKLTELAIYVLGGDWGKDVEFESSSYSTARCIRGAEFRNWNDDKGSTASPRKIKNSSLVNRVLKDGDILVEISGGGPDQPVGRTVLIDKAALSHAPEVPKICTNFVRLLRTAEGISSRFLNLYLTFFYASGEIRDYQAGSNNLRNLKFNDYLGIDIPIPPLPEQHRIVAKIEELFSELDKGIENLKTARAQLKVYRQALLKHAFEGKLTREWRAENQDKLETADVLLKRIQQERAERYQQQLADWEKSPSIPLLQRGRTTSAAPIIPPFEKGGLGGICRGASKPKVPKPLPPLTAEELAELPELPEGWAWARLGNTNVTISDGPFGSNLKSSDYVDSGVRVIRLENIGSLGFIEDKKSFITEAKYELLKNHTVSSGDIIFSSFIIENVRVALLPFGIKRAINKADCFCIRLYGDTLSNVFAVMFLSTRHAFKQLEAQIHGVGRPRINTTQLKEVAIPVCGALEQQAIISQIESRLSETDHLDQTITTSLQQAEALRQSILKKAFSGHLVPQDPHDEPASALLARIKAERAKSPQRKQTRRMVSGTEGVPT